MRQWIFSLTAATSAVVLGIIQPAIADAIDGDWCRTDGKRMSIRGPAIVTPAVSRLTVTTPDIPFLTSSLRARPEPGHGVNPITRRISCSCTPGCRGSGAGVGVDVSRA